MSEPDWLVTDLIERGSRTILAGAEGAGKSLLAFTLAVQAGAGLPVLANPAWTPPWQVRTLYVELEMGRRTVARRAHALRAAATASGHPLPAGAVGMIRLDGLDPNPRRSRDAADILAQISAFEPDLVIFDPLYKMLATDKAPEEAFGPLVGFLDQVRAVGAATILVHHLRKAGFGEPRGGQASDLYGSSFLLRFPELVAFVHDDGDRRGRLEVKKDREGFFEEQGRSFPIRRGGAWPIGLYVPDGFELDDAILRILRLEGARSASALAREMDAGKGPILDALERLGRSDRVHRVGRGNRTAWDLTEHQPEIVTDSDD